MTFDGTKVDVDELRKFSTGAHGRAHDTTSAADTVAGVHLGRGMLGWFNQMFVDGATDSQREVVSRLRAVASALTEDGDIASTNADEFDDTNTAQASQFMAAEKELP